VQEKKRHINVRKKNVFIEDNYSMSDGEMRSKLTPEVSGAGLTASAGTTGVRPACPFAVNRHEFLLNGETQSRTATHDETYSARHGNMSGQQAGVSRGHSSSSSYGNEGLNAAKRRKLK